MREEEPRLIYGVHPVMELLSRRPHEIHKIYVSSHRVSGFGRALRLARHAGIPVTHLPHEVLGRKVGARAAHQGIAAEVAPASYAPVAEVCARAAAKPDGLLVLLDGVTDAGNFGSILRTAAAAGADGVILAREGTVGLTAAVAKASAGNLDQLPVAREARPSHRLQALAELGFTSYALDPRGESAWDRLELTGRLVLVAGGEERGLRPGILGACHGRVAVPLAPGVDSLNVAVAVGVVLFEAVRQRRAASLESRGRS